MAYKCTPFPLKTFVKKKIEKVTDENTIAEIDDNFDFSSVKKVKFSDNFTTNNITGLTQIVKETGEIKNNYWAVLERDFSLYSFSYWTDDNNNFVGSQENGSLHSIELNIVTFAEFKTLFCKIAKFAIDTDKTLNVKCTGNSIVNMYIVLETEKVIKEEQGIIFKGPDKKEHKLAFDQENEQHPSSNVIIYVAEYSNGSIAGIVDSPSLEEIRQNILNGAQIWLQLDTNAEPKQYLKLVTTAADAAYFIQLDVYGNKNTLGCYIYGDRGDLRYRSFTNSSGK